MEEGEADRPPVGSEPSSACTTIRSAERGSVAGAAAAIAASQPHVNNRSERCIIPAA